MSNIIDAVLIGEPSSVLKLIQSGSDINVQDDLGRSPLILGVIENNFEVVKLLIENGANVNIQDDLSQATALHFAAQQYALEIGKLLLTSKALVDVEDVNGNTPLSDAVFYGEGKGEFIKLLLGYGADQNKKNKFDVSPYDLANTIDNFDTKRYFGIT
jgi:uncharacterized protein